MNNITRKEWDDVYALCKAEDGLNPAAEAVTILARRHELSEQDVQEQLDAVLEAS